MKLTLADGVTFNCKKSFAVGSNIKLRMKTYGLVVLDAHGELKALAWAYVC